MNILRLPTKELNCKEEVWRELYVCFFGQNMTQRISIEQIVWPPPFNRPDIVFYDELMMKVPIPDWVESFQFHQIFVIKTQFWHGKEVELKSSPVNVSPVFWINANWLGNGQLISRFAKLYSLDNSGTFNVCIQRKSF